MEVVTTCFPMLINRQCSFLIQQYAIMGGNASSTDKSSIKKEYEFLGSLAKSSTELAKHKKTDQLFVFKRYTIKAGYKARQLEEVFLMLYTFPYRVLSLRNLIIQTSLTVFLAQLLVRNLLLPLNIVKVIKWLLHNLGGNLAEVIMGAKAQFEEDKIVYWLIQLLLAAQYMHKNGVVHGNLKPQKVLFTSSGAIKISGFGVAQFLNASEPSKAATSPSYTAPEVLKGTLVYDHHADVWSLGCILYELCTFKPLVDGKMDRALDKYSAELKEILGKMLEHDSFKRPGVNDLLQSAFINKFIAEKLLSFATPVPKAEVPKKEDVATTPEEKVIYFSADQITF
eukprot:TRINITY_DN107098_c0_g1_i1.p1 TRINITY_DN107098_c0_g1~~TRINITY_DN107098_c0_g1_i1.p1  ORF type:complete len:340 (+),score=26.64 TRINITY_DN107098_c0_g1_i1:104-1123(+)